MCRDLAILQIIEPEPLPVLALLRRRIRLPEKMKFLATARFETFNLNPYCAQFFLQVRLLRTQ